MVCTGATCPCCPFCMQLRSHPEIGDHDACNQKPAVQAMPTKEHKSTITVQVGRQEVLPQCGIAISLVLLFQDDPREYLVHASGGSCCSNE